MMTMGERIKILRQERELSQEGLAELLGVTRQSVSKWETDGAVPDLDKLTGMCDLFGVTMDYLVREMAQKPPDNAVSLTVFGSQLSRRWIAGLVCIGLAIASAPLFRTGQLPYLPYITSVPLLLFSCGVVLLCIKKHSALWCTWSVLLVSTLAYSLRNYENILTAMRYVLNPDWAQTHSFDPPNVLNPLLLLLGSILLASALLMLWTVLAYRRSLLPERWRRLKWRILSGTSAALSCLLLCVLLSVCIQPAYDVYLYRLDSLILLVLYLLYWLFICSLTLFLVLLTAKRMPDTQEPPSASL